MQTMNAVSSVWATAVREGGGTDSCVVQAGVVWASRWGAGGQARGHVTACPQDHKISGESRMTGDAVGLDPTARSQQRTAGLSPR